MLTQITQASIDGCLNKAAVFIYYKYRTVDMEDKTNTYRIKNGKADIPDGNVTISSRNHHYREQIKSVNIPESVFYIEDGAFANSYNLEHIALPSKLKSIGEKAFWHSSIKDIEIPKSVHEIPEFAFRGCHNLTDVKLNKGLKSIGKAGFYECNSIKKLTLPDGLEKIGHNAFGYCFSLEEINIPNSVKEIGKYIFEECQSLQKITFDDNFIIDADTFGDKFPKKLLKNIGQLERIMSSAAYQKYVLNAKTWTLIDEGTRFDFFVKRNTKGNLLGYGKCIKGESIDLLGDRLLSLSKKETSKDVYQALYNFLYLFYDLANRDLVCNLYGVLENNEKAEKYIDDLKNEIPIDDLVCETESTDKCEAANMFQDFSYYTIDQFHCGFYQDIAKDFDLNHPINTIQKKKMISYGKHKVAVKFQSIEIMNDFLPKSNDKLYDPNYIIENKLYEQKTELIKFYNRSEPQEVSSIKIDSADYITIDSMIHRLKLIAIIVDVLKKDGAIRTVLDALPKKKDGTFCAKRTAIIAPFYTIDEAFSMPVLCAKTIKDSEIEIAFKCYQFQKIDDFNESIRKANEIIKAF